MTAFNVTGGNQTAYRVETGENTAQAKASAAAAAASALTVAAVAAELAVEPAIAYYPVPRKVGFVGGTQNLEYVNGFYQRTTGNAQGLIQFDLDQQEKAASSIQVRIPFEGAFTTEPNAQLVQVNSTIGDRITGTVEGDEYVVDLPITGDPTGCRVRWNSATDGKIKNPYIVPPGRTTKIDPATTGGKAVVEQWHRELFRRSGNLFTAVPNTLAQVSGAAPTLRGDKKTYEVAANTQVRFTQQVQGLALASEYYFLLVRLHTPENVRNPAGMVLGDYQNGNTADEDETAYHDGEYFGRLIRATDGNGNPAHVISVNVDTRSLSILPASDATIEIIGLFSVPDASFVQRIMADPVRLIERLAAWEKIDAVVSAAGFSEGAEFTYATLPDAVRPGHKRITCGETQRLTDGLLIPGKDRVIDMSNGASLRGSTAYTITDFAATSADANVYFRASPYDPDVLAEGDGDTITRMGIPNPTGTNLFNHAASEADVRANAGAWWYGNGSEGTGIYIRPYGDVTAGKTWEVPNERCYKLIEDQPGGSITVRQEHGVSSGFTRKNVISEKSSVTVDDGVWRTCSSDVWSPDSHQDTDGYLKKGLITDAGNDGYNSNPGAGVTNQFTMVSSSIDKNNSDGASAHGVGRTIMRGRGYCSISGNGKMDVVHIAPCDMHFEHLRSRGSRNGALIYTNNPVTRTRPDVVEIASYDADLVYIDTPAGNETEGRIVGLIDTVANAENVEIVRLGTAA